MSLLEEIKKLRELEQAIFPGKWKVDDYNSAVAISPAPKETRVHGYGYGNQGFVCDLNDGEYHEYHSEDEQANTAKFIAVSHNLAPAMLEVLGMIRAGDADILQIFIDFIAWHKQDGHLTDKSNITTKQGLDMLKRFQKMAELMEQEARDE